MIHNSLCTTENDKSRIARYFITGEEQRLLDLLENLKSKVILEIQMEFSVLRKHSSLLIVIVFLSLLLGMIVDFAAVFCWSNGGLGEDPNNPDYGTHGWIAHHALDWLPTKEKQFIIDNIADYPYGIELPNRGNF